MGECIVPPVVRVESGWQIGGTLYFLGDPEYHIRRHRIGLPAGADPSRWRLECRDGQYRWRTAD